MGGIGGEVRAKTPEEAWAEFDEEIRPEIESQLGLFLDAPLTRETAIKSMWQDPKTHWWILEYHFSK